MEFAVMWKELSLILIANVSISRLGGQGFPTASGQEKPSATRRPVLAPTN